jgi:hypothetical protein
MAESSDIDIAASHRYFSVECFNLAWDLIEKPDRTSEENDQMVSLSQASLWHWTQRPDCTPTNLSIGYWQISHIYALLGKADNARHYARLSLSVSQKGTVPPFYLAYAHEALARAAAVGGNTLEMANHIKQAQILAERVTDEESKKLLLNDLESIK